MKSGTKNLFFLILPFLILLLAASPATVYAQTCTDGDGDGYGLNGDASCPNTGVDCDDTDDTMYPDAPMLCDAKDNNCDGWIDFSTDKDVDEDGVPLCTHWQTGLKDCDDNNPNRFPGNIEGPFGDPTCSDGIDNDCNNRTDSADNGCSVNCNDIDGDGYGSPGNVTCPNGSALDCNNTNAAVNPGATDDSCNGVDNNCSGTPDDEYVDTPTNCGVGACASTGTLSCSSGVESDSCVEGTPAKEGALGHPTCSDTVDNDCDGTTDASDVGCQGTCLDDDGDGYGFYGDVTCPNGSTIDCDDDNDQIHPAMTDDVCDGVDANCSGTADDEYTPTVTNCGIGECATTGLLICTAGATVDNCSPLAPGSEGPFGDPTCGDTLDNDCDGDTDAGDNDCNPLDQDNDGDGFCEVGPCQNPANLTGDCDDTDAVTYPGAPQLCDAIDNDCDGWQDFYTDKDVDGDGVTLCTHWQTGLRDCDDNNSNRFPGNIEGPFGDASCIDAIDNDCDNKVDGADIGCSINCSDNDNDGYGSPGNVTCPNGNALDCNDGDAAINPGMTDANCDGVDNSCSGTPDDEYVDTPTNCGVGACADTGTLTCSAGVESDSCVEGTPVVEGPLGDGTCSDTSDNDCDGTTDALDTGCQSLCLDDDGDGYGLYGHASCTNVGVDCDDSNININPGAADDNCDNIDDNCSGTPDDEYTPTVTNCGVGECATTGLLLCTAGATVDNCSPLAPGSEGPFGDPTCGDTLDNDCDGDTDTGDNDCNPLDQDNDGDGYCEVGPCQNPANLTGDCNDTDVYTYPGAPRLCDAVDNDCDGWQDFYTDKDVDGDGVTLCTHWQTGLKDCDDNNSDRYPGNVEGPFGDPTCFDGIDNDCNNKIDDQDLKCLDQCNDSDGDGYGVPGHPSCVYPEEDCNDSNNLIHPGAADTVCDGVDDNCSGTADDEYTPTPTNCGVGACASTGTLTCSGGAEVDDCTPGLPAKEGALGHPTCTDTVDNDCDGATDASDIGCQSSCLDDDGDGYGHYGDASCPNGPVVDCDDNNININPGASDGNCDNVDNNCSGTADDEYTPTVTNCGLGECVTTGFMNCNAGVLEDDCTPLPAGVEDYQTPLVCTDTLDNDCDGFTDTLDVGCNPPDVDNDGDGFCEVGPCQNPANLTGDCDDTDAIVHPGGSTTICDAKDTNCDGWLDFFTDKDVDGDGVPLCEHWQTGLKDCDDNDPTRYPGNPEGPIGDPTCSDGIDNDCDNETDDLDTYCVEPTCTTITNPRNGSHLFDLLDGNDIVLKTSCQWCHFDDSGTVDERTKCERCHADSAWGGPDDGTLKAIYTDPPPYGFSTAQNIRQHSSTVLGTAYGNWNIDCMTCHNPHLQEQDAWYGTSYGKLIKAKICYDNPVTTLSIEEMIEFTAISGPGSFADGPPHNENICEMCHTQTKFHKRDGSTIAHYDGDECVSCHLHADAFAAPLSLPNPDAPHDSQEFLDNCTYCHLSDTNYTAPVADSKCDQCHTPAGALKGSFPTATDVLGHTDAYGSGSYTYTNNCVDCHNSMFPQANLKHVRAIIPKSIIPGSNIFFSTYSGAGSFADGAPYEENICDTCHSQTNHHQSDGTAPGGQTHEDGMDCRTCHAHDNAFMPIASAAADAPHDTITDCSICHTATFYTDPVPDAACDKCHTAGGSLKGSYPTAPDVTTHQGGACVECHDPMNAQTNLKHIRSAIAGSITPATITFTAYSGADSFADGAPYEENLCDTCHSTANHHQSDGTAPGGQSHNNSADCRTCHAHTEGFSADPALTTVSAPHDTIADCTYCHVGTTYTAVIPDSKCNQCHTAGGALKGSYPTAQDVLGHTDLNGSGSYTYTNACVDCHNPMYDQSNLKHVRSTIAGSILPATITFTAYSGVGSFADGAPYEENLCDTCHSLTNSHQADGTAPGGQDHNNNQNCTVCHPHSDAYLATSAPAADAPHDTVTDCFFCHGGGTFSDPIPNAQCEQCHTAGGSLKGSYPTAPDVATHQSTACIDCHDPMNPQSNLAHIRIDIQGSLAHPSIIYFTAYSGAGSFSDGAPYNENLCDTCHSITNHHQWNGTAPGGQNHKEGQDCRTCHAHLDGFSADPALSVVSAPHDGILCEYCHLGTNYEAAIPDSKCDVCHTPGGSLKPSYPTAQNVLAHSDVNGSGSYIYSFACVDCHEPMYDQTNIMHVRSTLAGSILPATITLTSFTGAGSFSDGAPYEENVCDTCHSLTLHHQADGTAPNGQNHQDGENCTGCHAHDAAFVSPSVVADTPHDTITQCTYCHVGGNFATPVPNSQCDQCHTPGGALKGSYPTAWDVTAHQGRDCVECHDPMNVQTNMKHVRTIIAGSIVPASVTFTSYSGAGSFSDGPAYEENVCDTCHSTANHHQSDGIAPGGQSHYDNSDCRVCHAHIDGFSTEASLITVSTPHDTVADCTYCHVGTVYETVIPDSQCNQCHTAGGALKGSYPTAQNVTAHAGSTYGAFSITCVECHNPMYDQTNQRHIRSSIAGSIVPATITFTAFSGVGSFADGPPYPENICDTCHSQTNHHQSDGISPGGQDHENGNDCLACHSHNNSFLPGAIQADAPHDTVGDCYYCHVGGNFTDPIPNTQCDQCHTAGGALKGSYPTAQDVATHQTRDCVECHDPMYGQTNLVHVRSTIAGSIVPASNIVFTAYSGAGSFADGAPYEQNICDTCHSTANHHHSDGTAPGGQDHKNSTDCRTCHAHIDGFSTDAALTTISAPHDTIVDCTYCHIGTNYEAAIPDSQCEQCHTAAGALKGSYPTAQNVLGHTDANGSGGYTYTNSCIDCHNPMYDQTNLRHIRGTLAGSIIPATITFTTTSGAGSHADGAPYEENVCNTCHSLTLHHQADGTAPNGQSHNDGQNCASCHLHSDAFLPTSVPPADAPHDTVGDCYYCHVGGNFTDPIPNSQCEQCHTAGGALKGSYPTAQDVATHQSGDCVECHDPMYAQTNLVHVRSTIAGSIVPASNIVFTAYTGAGSFADGVPYEENICNTCHSTANHHQSDGVAPGGQDHKNSTDCRSCHAHIDGFSTDAALITISAPHDTVSNCDYCHIGTNYETAIPDSQCEQCHTAAGALKGSYPTAQNVLGHTDANGSGGYTYTNSCIDCHNPMYVQNNIMHVRSTLAGSVIPATITLTSFTGVGSFSDGAPYEENVCDTCHSQTLHHQADGTAPNGQNHQDSENCTGCHAHDAAFMPPSVVADVPHDTITQCTYCHVGGSFANPIPNSQCEQCHTAGGALKGSYPTAQDVATHQSGDCVECHDPMYAQTNLVHVRSTIAGSIVPASNIVFTAYTGAGSFADGASYEENICDTCHSTANHHQSDGVAPGGQDHKNSTDCRSCHAHIDGFSTDAALITISAPHDTVSNCDYCHIGTNYETVIPDSQCEQCHTAAGALKGSYPTAQNVLGHTDANGSGGYTYTNSCIDCHNPMYDQNNIMHVRSTLAGSVIPATITLTSFTGVGSFSDGAPYEENVCDTCHSQTLHHQADGTAPNGQNHQDSENCTGCHAHDAAFMPPSVAADTPHDTITQCTYCHVGGNFTDPIPNSQCDQCHTAGGALKGSYPTAQDVATHQSGDCVECHDPMYAQTNLVHVRSTIAGSIVPASNIVFTAYTGAGSFADGVPYEENICDTCHSTANHHQSDGVAPGGQDHKNSTDCRSCHAHIEGFSTDAALITISAPHDTVSNCDYCHIGTNYETAIPDSQCEQCHTAAGALKGSYPTAQNVLGHTDANGSGGYTYTYTCVDCHEPMYDQTNLKHIRSTLAGSRIPASNIVFTSYTGAGSLADGALYEENVCDTCHSLTQFHRYNGSTVAHEDGNDCTACHKHGNAYLPDAIVADAPHESFQCSYCHTGVNYADPVLNSSCEQCHTAGGALKGSFPTAPDVATHQSRDCVECHDPMNAQTNLVHVRSTIAGSIVPASNILFTAYSGVGSFADGAPYNENVCDTCHSTANHHQSDGVAPGGQSHNDSTDCRSCHAHIDGFSQTGPVADTPHESIPDCYYCHVGGNFTDPIPDSQCEQCHTAGGALKGSYPTAQNVLGHTDANGSGGYTYTNTCVDCHDPMNPQTNLRHVRSTFTGSIVPASNIVFTAFSGAGSFADGPPYDENVCSTCHSLTLHHQADGTAPNGQSHNDGQNCIACHPHSDAFMPSAAPVADAPHDTVADCYYCHVGGNFTDPIPNSQCEQCHTSAGALKGSYPTAQDVATHQSRDCVECHDPMYAQTNLVHVRSTISGSIVPASNIVFTAYSGVGSFADGAAYEENICDTCHGGTNHHQSDGVAPGGQDHKNSTDCRTCHAHGDGFSTDAALITVSGPHDTVSNCDYCHIGTNYETVIPDSQCNQCHTAGGALKGSYPTAQNVLGHTDANGSGGYTYTNSCVDCHNPMYDQANLRHIRSTLTGSIIPAAITFTATSGAGSHSDGAPYEENVCSTCHSLTLHHQADGTAPNGQSHNDGQNCASCHLHSDAFLPTSVPPADAPHDTVGDCYYCHVGGNFTDPIPNSQCDQCHTAGGSLKGSYPTAQDVATHQSRDCVECHDPMYAQTNLVHVRSTIAGSIVPASNIVFTAYSGVGSFADGAAYEENICDTCHGGTNHHQSDGVSPGGQDHKNSTDCRTCHAHGDGFSTDAALITVSGPHDTVSNCDYCHIGTNYETVIPDSQCNQCHTAGGALKGSYPTAQNVLGHTDANGSGGYTYTNSCVDCHNPMYDQTNLRHIRSTLTGSIIPAAITFTATSGAGSHSDGAPYEENVCSTCHSLTLHHQADGTAPNGQSHNDGQNCASCHLHSDAFLPTSVPPADAPHDTVGDCYYCHVGGNFTDPIPNSQCDQCHTAGGSLKGSYPTAQDVATHQSRDCVECHDPMYAQTNLVHVRSTIAGSIVPASNIVFTAYSGVGSFADGAAYEENICDTCHGGTNHHQSDGVSPGGQDHKNSTDCRTCHAHGDGFSTDAALITVSGPHDTVADCTYCHGGTDYEAAIPDSQCNQCHTAGGALKGSYPTAQNVLGHTDANGSGGYTYTNSCVDCHNPMYDQTNLRHIRSTLTGSIIPAAITFTATSGAGSHSDGAPYEENVCSTCHSLTLHHQADGTAPNGQSHNDGQNCASCHLHSDAFLPTSVPPADAPHDTVGDCYYCHVGGNFTDPIPNSQCDQCHTSAGALKGSYPTAQDVATHQSRDCVECHDPMYAQTNLVHVRSTIAGSIVPASNIVFTAYSGVGSFADGAAYNENICDTCHSTANHHQSDGVSPGGQDHKNATDCRTCHAHGDGFSTDAALITVSGPHDTVSNCDYCHIGTDYEAVIPDSQCNQCHTAAGALKGSYPTAQNVLGHTDANGSGGYTYTNACIDCHNPMYDQTNLRHIRSTLTGSIIPATITFTATSGVGSHADGAPYEENVCNTCHSLTLHHQADGTAPNGQSHNDSQNCASCHLHSDAFLPTSVPPADAPHDTVGDCYYCHVGGNFTDPIPNSQCDQCHTSAGALKGSYPTAQDVATHQSRDCVECHDPMYAQTNLVHVRSTIAGSIVPATITFTAYSGVGSFGDGAPYEENICDTCHGGTNHQQWDGTAPGGQDHKNSTDCRTCHAHIDGFSTDAALVTVSAPHDTVSNCDYCHVGTNYETVIPDSQCEQCHTAAGVLKGSYPTAQNVLGHTDANGSGGYTYTNACIDCHNPMYDQTNLRHIRGTLAGSIVPASSITFTTYSGAGSFADGAPYEENVCDTCHSQTQHHQSDGVAPGGQNHNDSQDCRTCHAHADGFLSSMLADVPHDTVADCNYCHVGGNFTDPIPNSQCEQCHTAGGALKGSYPTAQNVATHQTGECVECHDPMNAQTNLVHVRSTIAGSIVPASNIVFTAYSGVGSFGDGAPYEENICDTCHSTANHHQSDGTAPGGQDHKNSTDCRTCHAHIDGFSTDTALITVSGPHDTVSDCAFCHVGTNYETVIPDSKCDQCHTAGGSLKGSYPTAQDVLGHTDANGSGSYTYTNTCVDCHEPMYDQTNSKHVRNTLAGSIIPATITFTSYTGAGSFSNGAPYEVNVCDTCHSATNHHQADGTAPGGQDHKNGTDCTSCHPHSDAYLADPTQSTVSSPHDTVADCTYCHVGTDYEAPIPDSKCNDCHTAGGALKGSYPTAQDVATHQSTNCVECHEPMYDQTNLVHVRSTIAGSIVPASNIVFTAYSGVGSFGDGAPYEENICDTCHSTTNHHQSDGLAPGGQDHQNSTDCRTCHAHIDGFSTDPALITVSSPHDTVGNCDDCHVGTDYEAVIPDSKCDQCHTAAGVLKGSYPTAQDVITHSDLSPLASGSYTYTFTCVACHEPMYDQTNLKHVRDTLAGSITPATITFTAYSGAGSFSDGAPYEENVCETCHTLTTHHLYDGSTGAHNDSLDCTGCHAHNDGFVDNGGGGSIPPPHDLQTCDSCHILEPDYTTPVANAECQACHDASAPGSNGVGWGDCRTETGTTNILAGAASRNVPLTTPLADTTKAFLLVDSAGPQATVYGRDHTVSGYIAGANTLTFEREGTAGQAEVSYALVECLYTEFTVQRGEIQLANGVDLNTQTLGTPIDLTRSMVIVNARTNVAADQQHQASVIGQLLSATEVEVKRAATASTADTFVRYEVVEFGDEAGVTIQKAEFAFNGNSFIEATLPTPVNMDSTWLYFTYWSDHDGPQQTAISGQLTNINKVMFNRHENMPYDNRIRYFVVSFPAGQVTVQRGSDSYLGGGTAAVTHDIPITPVSALDKAFSFVTNTTADRGDGGTVLPTGTYIEAENYSSVITGTGNLNEVTLGGELNGGTSLQTTGAGTSNCSSVTGGGAEGREYMLNFQTAGTYNIWMRSHAAGKGSNTMYVGFFSGTEPADGCIAALEVNVYNVWNWSNSIAKNSGPGGSWPSAAQFTVSTPGIYPIRIWARENLNAIDGIFVDTVGNTPSDINHGVDVDPTQGTEVPFPRNRWTEALTSTSNLQMANWRGDTAGADADIEWQVMDFTGTIGGGGGSDLKVVDHYGSTYGAFSIDCVECHNPMSAQSNLAFIRSSIGGNTVVFTAYTGTNSFADGDATNDGICEVCHTLTDYHRNDGTEPIQSHNNGKDCRNCHKHLDGYSEDVNAPPPHDTQPFRDNCDYCHVDTVNYGLRIPDSKCQQCHSPGGALKGSFPTAQDVLTHSDVHGSGSYTYTNDCVDCHDPMWAQTNLSFIQPTLTGSIVPGSNIVFTSYAGSDSFADGPPYEENLCDTCHSQTKFHQSDGTAPNGQEHNDGLDCAGCHPHDEAFLPSENDCVFCHNQSPPFNSSDPNRRQIVENIPGDGGGDFASTSHHVRNAISSQEIVTKDECLVCHDQSLHKTYGDGISALLIDQDTGATITYDGTGKSIETFCVSCHDSDGSILYGTQPFINSGDTNSPIDIGWANDVVSHSIAGTNEACFNCHGDPAGNANGHGSDNPYIHKYTFVPGQSHLFCYNCHDGSVSSVDVQAAFDLPFTHRWGSEECKACHDQHNAEPGLHVEGSENLADMIGGVNKGMGFNYQYEICFQCHTTPIDKTHNESETDMDTTFGGGGVYLANWDIIPDIQSQFSTSNYAYHPLFAAGRNQPANNLNSQWNASDYRKDDGAPGGPFDGLDNNFVDGWKATSLVTCSDCHGNGTSSGARGIHGSDFAWLSLRLDNSTNVQVTTAGAGVIYPNSNAPSAQPEVSSTFCVNCHRADVYGYGSNDFTPPFDNQGFSRLGHQGDAARLACQATNLESRKGGYNKIGCANCHGGGEVAGIHGTNYGVGTSGNDEMGKRFMNGNSWDGHTLGDVSGDVTCYTGTPPAIGQSMSSCSQHGNGISKTPNYYYQW